MYGVRCTVHGARCTVVVVVTTAVMIVEERTREWETRMPVLSKITYESQTNVWNKIKAFEQAIREWMKSHLLNNQFLRLVCHNLRHRSRLVPRRRIHSLSRPIFFVYTFPILFFYGFSNEFDFFTVRSFLPGDRELARWNKRWLHRLERMSHSARTCRTTRADFDRDAYTTTASRSSQLLPHFDEGFYFKKKKSFGSVNDRILMSESCFFISWQSPSCHPSLPGRMTRTTTMSTSENLLTLIIPIRINCQVRF